MDCRLKAMGGIRFNSNGTRSACSVRSPILVGYCRIFNLVNSDSLMFNLLRVLTTNCLHSPNHTFLLYYRGEMTNQTIIIASLLD